MRTAHEPLDMGSVKGHSEKSSIHAFLLTGVREPYIFSGRGWAVVHPAFAAVEQGN